MAKPVQLMAGGDLEVMQDDVFEKRVRREVHAKDVWSSYKKSPEARKPQGLEIQLLKHPFR